MSILVPLLGTKSGECGRATRGCRWRRPGGAQDVSTIGRRQVCDQKQARDLEAYRQRPAEPRRLARLAVRYHFQRTLPRLYETIVVQIHLQDFTEHDGEQCQACDLG